MSYSQTVNDCLSQFLSHSLPSAAIHQRPPSGHHAWSRPNVDWDSDTMQKARSAGSRLTWPSACQVLTAGELEPPWPCY